MLPAMWGRETFTTVESRTSMKVEKTTDMETTQRFTCGTAVCAWSDIQDFRF
jgi:hypothetical protein